MSYNRSRKLIIGVLIVLLSIGSFIGLLIGFLWMDQNLDETRGYGLVGRPAPPSLRAVKTLALIVEAHEKSWDGSVYRWPEAKTIAANVPKLVLVEDQPYTNFRVYMLKSEKTKQVFLYSPKNKLVTDSKLTQMMEKLWSLSNAQALPVVACVMAARQDRHGVYYAYKDYPSRFKKTIGDEAWKTWYFIMDGDLIYYVRSDIPPVPGCIAHVFQRNPKLSKFYYPEEIIPLFKAIYPDANIPREQIF